MALAVQATATNNANPAVSLTTALDVGTATNRVLVVGAWGNGAITATTGVQYAGVNCTERTTVSPNNVTNSEIWSLDDPTTGSNNIVVAQNASASIGYGAVAFNDAGTVDATSMVDTTFASQDDPTISITTDQSGSALVDNIEHTSATLTGPGTGQTQVQNVASGEGWNHGVSYEIVGAAGAYTQSWTTSAAAACDYSVVEVTEDIAAGVANHWLLMGV